MDSRKDQQQDRFSRCRECEHFHITWDKHQPYGCRAMDFRTSGSPHDLVVQTSGERCNCFHLKKRLRREREERAGSGEPSPFRQAALASLERLEGGASPEAAKGEPAPTELGYEVPWEATPAQSDGGGAPVEAASAEAGATPAQSDGGGAPAGEPPAGQETPAPSAEKRPGPAELGYEVPWDEPERKAAPAKDAGKQPERKATPAEDAGKQPDQQAAPAAEIKKRFTPIELGYEVPWDQAQCP